MDAAALPYRHELLTYIQEQRTLGRTIVLATAADAESARQVADQSKLFDLVIASDATANLSGESKRDRLVNAFGEKGFDYAANHWQDLVAWSSARRATIVDANPLVRSGAQQRT